MPTIKEFNKQNLKSLRQDMNAALAKLEKQYGIQIHVGNASFMANEVTFKTKCNTVSKEGTAITKEAQNWPPICINERTRPISTRRPYHHPR